MDVNELIRLIKFYLPLLSEKNYHIFGVWCILDRTVPRLTSLLLTSINPNIVVEFELKKKWIDGKISDEELKRLKNKNIIFLGGISTETPAFELADFAANIAYYHAYCASNHSSKNSYTIGINAFYEERKIQLCKILTMLGEQIKQ